MWLSSTGSPMCSNQGISPSETKALATVWLCGPYSSFTSRKRRDNKPIQDVGIEVTIDDAKAYAKPTTVTVVYKLHQDWELAEAVCTNERDVTNEKGEATIKAENTK